MKIGNLPKENLPIFGIGDKDPLHGNGANKVPFLEELNKIQTTQIREKLSDLINKIDLEGERLGKDRSVPQLKRYRDLVQAFLREAVNKTYTLREESSWSGGRHKMLTQVETVNKKLEELTNMVLTEQKAQIDILDKVGQIRGILVDLYS